MAIAFVVEDGTGKSDATSYVSVSEADNISDLNIHTAPAWDALSTEDKENLLMYATKSLDARTKWKGQKTTLMQSLEWPRTGVVDKYGNEISSNSIPFNLKMATVEYAKWNISVDKISNNVPENSVQEVKVDVITVKFSDASNTAFSQYYLPSFISDLLSGLGVIRTGENKVTFAKVIRTA